MSCKIVLATQKGSKTWVGKVINKDLKKFDFISGSWIKGERGMLEFIIKDEGYYVSQDYLGRDYWRIFKNEDGELKKEEITKKTLLELLLIDDLKLEKKSFGFVTFKNATGSTIWESRYKPAGDTYFAENENYYLISGKFNVKRTKYMRNFQRREIFLEKEIELTNEFFLKNDDIEIIFLDELLPS